MGLPSQDWLTRNVETDPDVDCEAGSPEALAVRLPRDRPFYAIDAYGEIQHVEWIGEQGGPFGPYVGIVDSDGECFPVSDISAWSLDAADLAATVTEA